MLYFLLSNIDKTKLWFGPSVMARLESTGTTAMYSMNTFLRHNFESRIHTTERTILKRTLESVRRSAVRAAVLGGASVQVPVSGIIHFPMDATHGAVISLDEMGMTFPSPTNFHVHNGFVELLLYDYFCEK